MKPLRLSCLLLSVVFSAVMGGAQPAAPVRPDSAPVQSRSHHEATRREAATPPPSAYNDHPKLAIILVIDQFRADYLERWRADFKGKGFDLFLDHGAYFPDCYYDYANLKTAPGHSTIGTGAYTDGHGISSNEWWDLARNQKRPISSVEDERYQVVGLPAGAKPETGSSPRNLMASTVGDELRLATEGQAKVFGVSLKDRAAILPSGAAANGAFWIDGKTGAFISSTYYMPQLPDWATAFNSGGAAAQAEQEAGVSNVTNFYEQVGSTPAANDYELAFAEALIQGEQLGQHNVTDMLTLSLSANDIVGHAQGPDSPEEHQMVDALDGQLDSFFTWLDKNVPGGLGNVWIALTADHGVAPKPATAAQYGLNAAQIDVNKLTAALNYAINMKFSPGEKIDYILPHQELPYISLNEAQFMKAGINEQEAELAVQRAMQPAIDSLVPPQPKEPLAAATTPTASAASATPAAGQVGAPASPAAAAAGTQAGAAGTGPGATGAETEAAASPNAMTQAPTNRPSPRPVLFRSYTRMQMAEGAYPPTPWGEMLAHSYSPNGGWYVMVLPEAFQMGKTSGTNHFSPYSYDRHVPLGFYGAPFAPGTYHGRVQPVDLAATYASLLGINQPSASVGRILTQALKPGAEVSYPREVVTRPRRGAAARHTDGAAHADGAAERTEPKPGAAAPAVKPATPEAKPGNPPAAEPKAETGAKPGADESKPQ